MATIFTPTVAVGGNNNDPLTSTRHVITCNASSAGIVLLRFQFQPDTISGVASDQLHFSVGKYLAATNCSTTAVPIEILFGGVSGISVPAGTAAVWSDWTNVTSLALGASDKIVLIEDNSAIGGYGTSNGNTNCEAWQLSLGGGSPTISYNLASGAGFIDVGSFDLGIAAIEGTVATTPIAIFSVGQSLDAPPKNTRMVGY